MLHRNLLVCAMLLLSGCAGGLPIYQNPNNVRDAIPRDEPLSASGNPESYIVFGKRYFVMRTSKGYAERGIASWYGKKFHGRRTSNGERYNMYAMTAAHKTLPLPSYVRVTNLSNNRSIVVRVNDRGPFVKNRIIDLSYTAAQKLDMVTDGTALVEVRALQPGNKARVTDTAVPAGNAPVSTVSDWRDQSHLRNRIYIQVGAFSERNNAEEMFQRLLQAQFTDVQILGFDQEQGLLHRVRIGPIHNVAATDKAVSRLEDIGFSEYQVVIE